MKVNSNLDMNNAGKVINLPLPTNPGDGVSKAYADALRAGEDWKDSVRVASTGTLTLAVPGATIDGVAMAPGDRVLAKDQTIGSEKGLYVWNGAAAAMTRTADADVSAEVTSGLTVSVEEGTANAGTKWQLITPNPINLGVTSLTFTQTGAPISAGTGLVKSGNTISLDTPVSVANGGTGATGATAARTSLGAVGKFAQDFGDGAATSFNIDHNLGTSDVTVMVYLKSSGAVEIVDAVVSTSNRVIISGFSTAPTAAAYRVVVTG